MEPPKPGRSTRRPFGLLRFLRGGVRGLLRVFFREIEVSGISHLPEDSGGVLVSWHPNGLIDPALLLAVVPRPPTFGARHGLFRVPLLGAVMHGLGTVPIYRAMDLRSMDPERRREANRTSLDALASRVAAGEFAALFPEGVSHDEPHPVEMKSGAARLYYRARRLRPTGTAPPVIVPVGLHYDKKKVFRSRALVCFHPPLDLPAELDRDPDADEPDEASRARARALTEVIETALHGVVHATADWRTHALLHRVRKLLRAEGARRAGRDPGKPNVAEETADFALIRQAYHRLSEHDRRSVARLRGAIESYDQDLTALGLDDHDLDRGPRLDSPLQVLSLLAQIALVFLFLPFPLLFGYLVNWPATLLVFGVARSRAKLGKDVASLKLLAGVIAYPLTWVAVAIAGALTHDRLHALFPSLPGTPWRAGAFLALLGVVGAVLSIRYVRIARETLRAIRVRLTRARRRAGLSRLRRQRSQLYDELVEIGRSFDSPAVIAEDGRITPLPRS